MRFDRRPLVMLVLLTACAASGSALAAGPKPCEALRAEIAAKIDARGVVGYTLEIVATDEAGERRIVGRCDGGTRRIVYVRQTLSADPARQAVANRTF
jgi:hypothetical protein